MLNIKKDSLLGESLWRPDKSDADLREESLRPE
jgi:hypothetical protein